jgi:hypothetical protein
MQDKDILLEFLNYPLNSATPILDRFAGLKGAIRQSAGGNQRFVYVPGKRSAKVVLVAHADTVWDTTSDNMGNILADLITTGSTIRSGSAAYGIGADDRAGCAILWLMKDSGHSLLVTDGEERGRIGSRWLMDDSVNVGIREELQRDHQFMVQLDRRNARDFKCYLAGTEAFREYVCKKTGYTEPDRNSSTDIVTLCRDIAGVNLSVGYRHEHTPDEELHVDVWQHTLDLVREWLGETDLPRFELPKTQT